MLSFALLSGLWSCGAAPASWSTVEADVGFGEFWEGFASIAERQGYPIDFSQSDRGLRVYVSKWRTTPAPFAMGRRTRLHGRFERTAEGQPGWRLQFYVQNQSATDIGSGFEPEEDDWSDAGQDRLREDVLLGQLRLRFGQQLGIQPSYRSH